jgi:secondary thiamine-phosphate synthase enzyme
MTRTMIHGSGSAIAVGAPDHQAMARMTVETPGPSLTDVTRQVAAALAKAEAGDGLATLFCRHTSASLAIQENASPEVLDDLVDALDRLAPRTAGWRHDDEGPDDMPAHVKATLTGASVVVPVIGGRLALGTWQAIYLCEHRDRPHVRELILHFVGSRAGS